MLLICGACSKRTARFLGERGGRDVFRCDDLACSYLWRTEILGHVRMAGPNGPRESDLYEGSWYHTDRARDLAEPGFAETFNHCRGVAQIRLAKLAQIGWSPGERWSRGLLDMGCGAGAFVSAALALGWRAYGADRGAPLLESTAKAHPELAGRLVVAGDVSDVRGMWDVITWHDVLEHVHDPFRSIRSSAEKLNHGGVLVIEAPDPACEEAIRDGADFRHVKPLEHRHLLSAETWMDMASEAGLLPVLRYTPVPTKLAVYCRRP